MTPLHYEVAIMQKNGPDLEVCLFKVDDDYSLAGINRHQLFFREEKAKTKTFFWMHDFREFFVKSEFLSKVSFSKLAQLIVYLDSLRSKRVLSESDYFEITAYLFATKDKKSLEEYTQKNHVKKNDIFMNFIRTSNAKKNKQELTRETFDKIGLKLV